MWAVHSKDPGGHRYKQASNQRHYRHRHRPFCQERLPTCNPEREAPAPPRADFIRRVTQGGAN
jgi:hypothetical protein